MKIDKTKLFFMVSLIIFGGIQYSCSSPENQKQVVTIVNESDIVSKTVGVKGMTCVGCEVTLEKELSNIGGVVSVKASASSNSAIIEFDSTKTNETTIRKTIKESGYTTF